MRIGISLLAGGSGKRVGSKIPKQFLELAGHPIWEYTLRAFLEVDPTMPIVIAVHPSWLEHLRNEIAERFPTLTPLIVPGGETRQVSSCAALDAFSASPDPPKAVLIHDVARCLIDGETIRRCCEAMTRCSAITTAIPPVDTLARIHEGTLSDIPPRSEMVSIQTPQGFLLPLIRQAHVMARKDRIFDATDDAQLMMRMGIPVHIVEGATTNRKISTSADLPLAEWVLEQRNHPEKEA